MLWTWFDQTFGKGMDPYAIIIKMQEELNELNMAVQEYEQWSTEENKHKVQEEMADLMMVIINLATNYDICYDAFVDSVYIKHLINRKRKWVEMPDGTFKHLPDDITITEK
jgi:NTP pyrophosphatase (non-canonical NTP hydrolase)